MHRSFVKRFLLMLVPLTALIAVVVYSLHHYLVIKERTTLAAEEANGLSLGTVAITKELKAITSDLLIIAQHSEFSEVRQRLNPDAVRHLQQDFLLLVSNKRLYDQARFIDKTGMEIARVNFNNGLPVAVPKEVLQDKSQRYYFREALALNKGEIYFSPLDLNIEQGKIEKPFKPMIRLATPVFNKEGHKRGVVILNYFGAKLIEQFETEATGNFGDAMILNSNGYWLNAPNPGLEWGFMLDHGKAFAKSFPETWERIKKADKGQFRDQNGLFTFETVYPLLEGFKSSTETNAAFAQSMGKVEGRAYFWKIVSQVPSANLTALAERETRKILLVFGPLYIIVAMALGGLILVRGRHVTAEKALRESEARTRLLLDGISVGFGVEDLNGQTILANEGWARILGYTPEEFLNMHFTEYTHPDYAAEDVSLFGELAEGKRDRYQVEKRYLAKNGEDIWGRLTRTLVRDEQGNPKNCLGVVEVITERKHAERALVESEARFKSFMEAAPIGIAAKDAQGRFTYVNPVVCQHFGVPQEAIIGKTAADFRRSDIAAAIARAERKVIETGTPQAFEGETDDMQLGVQVIRNIRFPIKDSDGKVAGIGVVTEDITERRQVEDALRAREAQVSSFIDDSTVGIFFKDVERRYVLVNDTFCDFHEQARDTVIGKRAEEFQSPDHAKSTLSEDRLVLESRQSIHKEETLISRNGVARHFSLNKFPVADANGTLLGLGGMSIEITELKQSEEALRKQALVWEQMSEGVVALDSEARILDMNPAAERMFGYSTDEVRGQLGSIFHSDEVQGKLLNEVTDRVRRNGYWSGEVNSVRKDGSTVLVEANVMPLHDENGNPIGRIAVNRDISERKRAVEALRESEERFSTAFQWTPVALCITRMDDGTHIYVNNRWIFELGHTREEVIGRSAIELGVWADAPRRAAFVERLKSDGSVDDFDAVFVTKNGAEKSVVVDGRLIEVSGEQRVLIAFRDVTAHNQLERQLAQAQKMEVVGQLTGGVAHDFNNLLQVVETSLELAKDTIPNGSEAEKFVDGALRAGNRGAKLTQQLLAFSRKQTLHPENLDAHSLIDGMTSLWSRTLGEDVSIETKFVGGAVNFTVDESGLTNALLNLALNARAAMPKGGTLTVAVGKQHFDVDVPIENGVLPAGDYVEISVADTGCGISGENLAHAFEPFFTTKEVGEGSGLGLSMVYGFARQSGGDATIESELGQGTTVRLMLPAAVGERVSPSDAQTTGKDARHAIKVLLVEDDADVRATTHMVLESLGCEVVEAATAAPVPDMLRHDDSIDLLLSDIVLPGGKNGIELAKEAQLLRPDLKVVLVSGYPEGTLEKAGLTDAGFPLLGKPFSKSALSEMLASTMA
ncbi:MAG: PAS domain S-box protein [Rhodospirillales bacterium]|jgi:PAS domain S-box-containing protein|nr:PAS domain S-box protein [Rhodospirillales bacterium]